MFPNDYFPNSYFTKEYWPDRGFSRILPILTAKLTFVKEKMKATFAREKTQTLFKED